MEPASPVWVRGWARRARTTLCIAGGLAVVLWWAPAILLALGDLAAGRVRFGLVMAWGDALKAMGRRDLAARLYEFELARCRRRIAVLVARRRA